MTICVLCEQVYDFNWPQRGVPELEKLVDLCRSMDSWLRAEPTHVIVVHCHVRNVCVHACVHVCMRVHACVHVCMHVHACSTQHAHEETPSCCFWDACEIE